MQKFDKPFIGIYEKALPTNLPWKERFEAAAKAGYDFMEISIDESDERLGRLDWSQKRKSELREAIADTGVSIFSMCLSGHRKFPLGSENDEISKYGMEIMKKAIQFSVDTGIRVVQLAGYDVFYEKSNERTQNRFYENLQKSVEWAGRAGVTLALEPVDTDFMNSVTKAMDYIRRINSPWLQLYPDIGNLVAANQDAVFELLRGEDHLIALHVKDAILNVIRRIPFGKGLVPFSEIFRVLAKMNFKGPMLIEMWTDDADDAVEIISDAREWVLKHWVEALNIDEELEVV